MFHQLTQAMYIFSSPYFYVIAPLHKLDCPDCLAASAFIFRCHLQQYANSLVWYVAKADMLMLSAAMGHHVLLAGGDKGHKHAMLESAALRCSLLLFRVRIDQKRIRVPEVCGGCTYCAF